MIYWKYFWRIAFHKLVVLIECAKAGILWRGIFHDLSKFRSDEFFASARYHLLKEGDVKPEQWAKIQREGKRAWGLHQERNAHHPEYWRLEKGSFPMSQGARLEMVCDWKAAEYYPDSCSAREYYQTNSDTIPLDELTREWVEAYLSLGQ